MGSTFSENSGETKIESILEATIQFTQALSNLVLKVQGFTKATHELPCNGSLLPFGKVQT
jgi:hypothetical protein